MLCKGDRASICYREGGSGRVRRALRMLANGSHKHAKWELFSTKNEQIDVDFGKTYGDEFAFLEGEKPFSVLLAKGSEVAAFKGKPITR